MFGKIYKLYFADADGKLLTEKYYIGQTRNTVESRIEQHKMRSKHNTPIYKAIELYGYQHLKYEIIEECLVTELFQKEAKYIKQYNAYEPNGYNINASAVLQDHERIEAINKEKELFLNNIHNFKLIKLDEKVEALFKTKSILMGNISKGKKRKPEHIRKGVLGNKRNKLLKEIEVLKYKKKNNLIANREYYAKFEELNQKLTTILRDLENLTQGNMNLNTIKEELSFENNYAINEGLQEDLEVKNTWDKINWHNFINLQLGVTN